MRDCTDITVVLDRSGSMNEIRKDIIGSFNAFIKDQQEQPGDAYFSLYTFSTTLHPSIILNVPIKGVSPLSEKDYVPGGWTALLDALGTVINITGKRLADASEDLRPDKVIFVIITDGEENSSHEFTRDKIFEMVNHQKDVYKWKFIFLAANQDAIQTGSQYGFDKGSTMTYVATASGSSSSIGAASASISTYRSTGSLNAFTEKDRQASLDNTDLVKTGAVNVNTQLVNADGKKDAI